MRGVVSKGKKVIEVKQKELYEINEDGEFLHKTELIKKKEAELRKNYSFVDPKRKKERGDTDQTCGVHGYLPSGIGVNHKSKRI